MSALEQSFADIAERNGLRSITVAYHIAGVVAPFFSVTAHGSPSPHGYAIAGTLPEALRDALDDLAAKRAMLSEFADEPLMVVA